MFYKKKGLPEESELVMCTVTKVQSHSVFANMEDYGISGMIHISEVSPGRIRNIRDYVKEGKVIVCKVLRVSKERGHVDLSLRRVSDSQRRNKVNQVKQEQKAEKIIEFVAKELKKDSKEIYRQASEKIFSEYPDLFSCFEDIVVGNADLEKLGIEKDLAKKLTELVKQRIKPPEVEISGNFLIESYEPDGVELIKDSLSEADKDENVNILYLGAGKYQVIIKAPDYKGAEGILDKATDIVTQSIGSKGTVSFQRTDKSSKSAK